MAPQQASDGERAWWEGSEQLLDLIDKGVDLSIDLLSCDEGRKGVLGGANLLNRRTEEAPVVIRDYTRLHDEFLESLLQEQTKLVKEEATRESPPMLLSQSSLSSFISPAASMETDLSMSSPKRRPLKLPRRSPNITRKSPSRPNKRQVVDVSTMEVPSEDTSIPLDSSSMSVISILTDKDLAPPCTFLHSSCRLQKDKGKGEPPGSDICATGVNPCLEKIRQKIELLTQVALDSRRKSTNMKRRKAKVTEESQRFTETRSIIELRMGFLSMQYGVLIRWDVITGKAVLVVLRKMCHESFYIKELVSSRSSTSKGSTSSHYHVYNVVGGNEAILQRDDATEVTLLEAPYRVDRPVDFTPTLLTVSVLKVEGLTVKYQYAVVVTFEGVSQKCRLERCENVMLPKGTNEPLEWHVSPGDIELDLHVTIEKCRRRHKLKRVMHSIIVPVNILDKGRLYLLKMDSCSLTLGIAPQSEFVSWVHGELDARRKEEVQDASLPLSPRMVAVDTENLVPLWDITCCMW